MAIEMRKERAEFQAVAFSSIEILPLDFRPAVCFAGRGPPVTLCGVAGGEHPAAVVGVRLRLRGGRGPPQQSRSRLR